jgi:hypothetical protein
MSRLTIDTGVAGNAATGDSLRVAFEKVNTNFAELYSELGGDSLDAISFNNNTISTDITNADLILTGNGTGGVVIGDFNFSGNKISTASSNANIDLDPAGTGNLILKSGNFLPNTDNTQYLGSLEKRWHTLYVGPGSININGVSITESGGKISLGTSTSISGTLEVNEIASADSSAIQINDGLNISGDTHLHGNLTVTGDLITLGRTTAEDAGSIGMSGTRILGSLELTNPNGNSTMAMGMSFVGSPGGEGQMIFEGNNSSGYALVPSNDNQYTLGRPEVAGPGSAAYWKNLYTYAINFPDETEQTTAWTGTLTVNDSGLTINGGTGTIYQGPSGVLQVGDKKGGVYHATSTSSNGLFTFGMNGSGIMSAAVEGSLFVGNNLPSNNGGVTTAYGGWLVVENGGKFGTDVDTLGNISIGKGVFEKFQTKQDATGTVEHDCINGHIFYHTSPDANWTANFTNLNIATSYATSVSIVIAQGGTGYYPDAVQIGGVAQTIKWQGNATPTPSTNRTDVVTFNILNNSGTYVVLGQLTGF